MKNIGKRIKEVRLKKGLSQEDLAEKSNVNLRTIQRIENNETTPRSKTLNLIFSTLEVEVFESETKEINRYLIWATLLTIIMIVCSCLKWMIFSSNSYNTGWNGGMRLDNFIFRNWILSLCGISMGVLVMSHASGLVEYKRRYFVFQCIVVILYLFSMITFMDSNSFELRPGLFLVLLSCVLLLIKFVQKRKEKFSLNKSLRIF
jgi:transcriptional regulator with XRE-family HTH domain